ncbi:ASCH domain-containing protein [Psychrobacter raelei]|uniref:ASCH domain-containing protein n=1 Tax=Psychrobacter raelei TaxID=2565531 RepID=A0AAU6PW33_9GAMM
MDEYHPTKLTQPQQHFLNQYLSTLTSEERKNIPNLDDIPAEHFCADEVNANECARLVELGIKTASCSLKDGWDYDSEPLPNIGSLTIVTDWEGRPICITQLTDIRIEKFKDVTEDFAQAEGEGDGTYDWWRDAHISFFTDYAQSVDSHFTQDSDLVLERFKKVYPL